MKNLEEEMATVEDACSYCDDPGEFTAFKLQTKMGETVVICSDCLVEVFDSLLTYHVRSA